MLVASCEILGGSYVHHLLQKEIRLALINKELH